MKRSDVPDWLVVKACAAARGRMPALSLLGFMSQAPEKVCWRAMERADERGLIEWGASIRWAWPRADAAESMQ